MSITRIFDLFDHISNQDNPKAILTGKKHHEKISYSISEYREKANSVSRYLSSLGISKGDVVVTLMENRPEWNFIDMGVTQLGAIHVSVTLNFDETTLSKIISKTKASVLLTTKSFIVKKLKSADLSTLQTIINIKKEDNNIFNYYQSATEENELSDSWLNDIKGSIQEDDIATIIYTSGTTSEPKGVVLTHKNLVSAIKTFSPTLPVKDGSMVAMSYLSLSHMGERKLNYCYQYLGIPIHYPAFSESLSDNILEIQPDIMATVPYVLDQLYKELINPEGAFAKTKPALKSIVCGGASIPIRLLTFFKDYGIPVYEVYGLTESTAILSFNYPNAIKFGTVGRVFPEVNVKISEEGEILCKGPIVMQGYWDDPESTEYAIDQDGWLHTGDLGSLDKDGFLTITGRKKEIFKISRGTYVSPASIEMRLKESAYIDQAMVIGEYQDYLAALIIPNISQLDKWFHQNGKKNLSEIQLLDHPSSKELINLELNKVNSVLKPEERIVRYLFIKDQWSVESGELSSYMKLKREYIAKKYSAIIDDLYNEGPAS